MKLILSFVISLGLLSSMSAKANEAVIEAMGEYLMFQEYESGIILPQQIDQSVFEAVTWIDTRDSEQFDKQTIPGAIHIEWRQVIERMDEIPTDRKVIVFCNTGSLSAQAAFALRVAGFDNVVVMQSGFLGWLENAAYRPSEQ
ncbi:MAG: rhodanese-like domain-containing protein [Litorivicinaceae bacterium]|jgi:rhodanese-related sulfurtransferase|nr:rhodanese-like domain-containing protein [Litorivicinus sp.]MDB2412898.1 rhodanese-like domain-containing protein [Litorivicinaceae bacterium]MDC1075996.1 rhodanese-like domain-containing protein [Litorivicinus sp.]MDF1783761.1 rhodanese-like domain-containing protein [Litorivicinaceae bacterium]